MIISVGLTVFISITLGAVLYSLDASVLRIIVWPLVLMMQAFTWFFIGKEYQIRKIIERNREVLNQSGAWN